jgi:hypothetical protein
MTATCARLIRASIPVYSAVFTAVRIVAAISSRVV